MLHSVTLTWYEGAAYAGTFSALGCIISYCGRRFMDSSWLREERAKVAERERELLAWIQQVKYQGTLKTANYQFPNVSPEAAEAYSAMKGFTQTNPFQVIGGVMCGGCGHAIDQDEIDNCPGKECPRFKDASRFHGPNG